MDSPAAGYNQNSASVRRLLRECREMQQDTSTLYTAAPLDTNLFEWHFTIRGPKDTEFEGGVYHGRILFPSDYPYRPPDIVFLTKNGRFELEKKICLTISSHHEETWRPSWSIRTVLVALIAFMPTRGDGAIASLDWTPEERKKLAKLSLTYKCDKCGSHNSTALRPEDLNETLSAEDVPEELQLRDSKKRAESSSPSAAESSTAPQAPSSASEPHLERNQSPHEGAVQIEPEVQNANANDVPLYQHAPQMSETENLQQTLANEASQAVQTIRDQIDIAISVFVLLMGILLLRKLYIYF